jgi:Asp-tRNA(Asn)/Glu-tRNA(Gln) amidotransferase A subunit family amidase
MRSAGPMARTVDDLIDLYRVITRPDPRDTWSLPYEDTADIHAAISPAGLRIGVMLDMGYGTTIPDDVHPRRRRNPDEVDGLRIRVEQRPRLRVGRHGDRNVLGRAAEHGVD